MMDIIEILPAAFVVLALLVIFVCLGIKDYREAKRFEAEVKEKSKDLLYRGTLWIP